MEAMGVALVLFTIICVPIIAVVGGIFATSVVKQYFQLRNKELELKRWYAEKALDQARLTATLPPWLDCKDPVDMAAWQSALSETVRVGRSIKV